MAWTDVKGPANVVSSSDWNTMVTYILTLSQNAGITSFADGDATPTVAGYRSFKTANTSPTTITDFDDGVLGQLITILINDADTTIQDNANITLQGDVDFVGAQYDSVTLVQWTATVWVEILREVAGGFGIQAFSDADATPDVTGYSTFKTANTGSTTITDFDGGAIGQKITVLINDANTTIQDNANIKLQADQDFAGLQYDSIEFIQWSAGLWVETGRKIIEA